MSKASGATTPTQTREQGVTAGVKIDCVRSFATSCSNTPPSRTSRRRRLHEDFTRAVDDTFVPHPSPGLVRLGSADSLLWHSRVLSSRSSPLRPRIFTYFKHRKRHRDPVPLNSCLPSPSNCLFTTSATFGTLIVELVKSDYPRNCSAIPGSGRFTTNASLREAFVRVTATWVQHRYRHRTTSQGYKAVPFRRS